MQETDRDTIEAELIDSLRAVEGVDDVVVVERSWPFIRVNAMVREQSMDLTDRIYLAEESWRDRHPDARVDLHVRTATTDTERRVREKKLLDDAQLRFFESPINREFFADLAKR